MDKAPDVVIPRDDPLDRVTDHIDIDWHVQVKPEWCKNKKTKGRGLQRGSCNTYSAIILADHGIDCTHACLTKEHTSDSGRGREGLAMQFKGSVTQ